MWNCINFPLALHKYLLRQPFFLNIFSKKMFDTQKRQTFFLLYLMKKANRSWKSWKAQIKAQFVLYGEITKIIKINHVVYIPFWCKKKKVDWSNACMELDPIYIMAVMETIIYLHEYCITVPGNICYLLTVKWNVWKCLNTP